MNILIINCGSSSLKYQLIDSKTEQVLAKGICERIGIPESKIAHQSMGKEKITEQIDMPTHTKAVALLLEKLMDPTYGIIQSLDENGHIVGVDISENMLEIAKQKWNSNQITYYHGDVLELDWNQKFDTIICYSMFPHFKENKMKAIKRLSILLNKGGKLCIAHSQSRHDINRLHLKAGEEVENDRLPEMSILENMFKTSGVSPVEIVDNESFFIIIGVKQN